MPATLRFLSARDVLGALPMDEAIQAMREAFIQLSSGTVQLPLRVNMPVGTDGSCVLVMPVHSSSSSTAGVKTLTIARGNPSKGLPLIHAVMVVMDTENGQPLGVMNAETLTGLRTGAASGLATDLLARKSASVAAIIGAGTQGRFQLLGICAVRKLRRIYVLDTTAGRRATFLREMQPRVDAELVEAEGDEVLEQADIVCCATSSRVPVFQAKRLKAGVHINGVGAYQADMREIPGETVARALIVVDSRESANAEAGDIAIPLREGLISPSDIYAELGELASGSKPGRTGEEEITLFKSVGVAVQDLAAAARALENAARLGLGTVVPF